MPEFIVELLQDAHFWVGVAFAILVLVMVRAGVPGLLTKALDGRGSAVQAQLDEANRLRQEAQTLLADIKTHRETTEAQAAADVKAAAAELAAQIAEQVLAARLTAAKSDPLIDRGVDQLAAKLQ